MKQLFLRLPVIMAISILLLSCTGQSSKDSIIGKYSSSGEVILVDGLQVLETWKMPKELNEISSIALIDQERMACIQDNDGIIFVYNLKTKSVEQTIPFSETGDYEGISYITGIFYVLRSDGYIFEVTPGNSKPQVVTYDLPLQVENDTEPMFYDSARNSILIGTKEKDLTQPNGKGIYSFDLSTKQMNSTPVYMINEVVKSNDEGETGANADNDKKGKKKKKEKNKGGSIKPSEIAINPLTRELFVLNGPKSTLLILDVAGNIKSYYTLDKELFPQPEGMCFTSGGDLFISSEGGKKGIGVIAKIHLN